jgi:DNA repair exonuclease SbcCD ATPase subunit
MKYMMVMAIALGCVSFESECGFKLGKWVERQGQNFRDGTWKPVERNVVSRSNDEVKRVFHRDVQPGLKNLEHNISKNNERFKGWFHREAQPEIKKLESNISKNNTRFKEWFHREAQPKLDKIGENIQSLWDRLSRNETKGIKEDIQSVEDDIQSFDEGVEKTRAAFEEKSETEQADSTDSTDNIASLRRELEVAEECFIAAETRLELAEAKMKNELAKAAESGRTLTASEQSTLQLEIATAKYEKSLKKIEVLRLRNAIRDIR